MATRILAFDDLGDISAPPGSAPWAKAVRLELQHMLTQATTSVQAVRNYVSALDRTKGYQQLDDAHGHPFPSLRTFAIAKPPFGLGYDAEILTSIAQETREMVLGQKVAEFRALCEHGTNQYTDRGVDNVNSSSGQGGNSRQYRIARLKRDHPDIAEALARGEYRSVHAAAKAAGLVHELSPLDYLHRYWRKVAPEDRLRFLIEMLTPNERRALMLGFEEED